ncbi:MAG: peptidoglycan DD-metalloendopeptidase family protein [Roseiflexaceae bacterium]
MEPSLRQRYHIRRQNIAARRRRIGLAIGGVVLLIILGVAILRQPTPVSAPGVLAPTSAAMRTPTSAARQTPTGQPGVAGPTAPPAAPSTAAPVALALFFDDHRFTYEPGFYAPQIQAFLDAQPGPLKQFSFMVGDRRHSFAEVLTGQSSYYSVNPRVVLALLELQSRTLSTASPSAEQIGWAIGYHGENGNKRGLAAQVRWAVRQILLARHDYPQYAPLTYADNSSVPPPPGMSMSEYAVARVLAPTTTPDRLPQLLQSFLETYTRLFGDPRTPPADWPPPAGPFLSWPLEKPAQVTSFFDHGGPFLTHNFRDGVVTYWGRQEIDIAFAYNGHDGWDYAAAPPDMALAAADGEVIFAGNADDNCATHAVVLDHGNGYRTLYWHLYRVDVAIGDRVARGQPVGMVGQSGCATGPHLHFGVQYLGRNIDPYGWCGGTPDPWAQHPAGTVSTWLWIDRPSPCGSPPPGSIVVDTDAPGFMKEGDGWQSVPVGYGGAALFVPSTLGASGLRPWELRPLAAPAVAVWRPELPAPGRYRVLAYVPYALSGLEDATKVRYRIRYQGGEAEIEIDDQLHANDWADLGTYEFAPDDKPAVSVSSLVEANLRSVWADAVMWVPVKE